MLQRFAERAPFVIGGVILALAFWGLLPEIRACEIGDPVADVVASWPRDQYLLVCFEGADGASSSAAVPLKNAVGTYGRRTNVTLVSSPLHEQRAEGAPAVLVSPRGMVLACFESPPADEEVKAVFESPARSELTRSLRENKAVFLCLLNENSKAGRKTQQVLKSALQLARELSDASTGVMTVAPSAAEEKYLVRNVCLQAPTHTDAEPVVALICANGRVADVTVGVPTEEQIIDRLQRVYRESGLVDPSRFGEDLLLVW
jgi:hypothetical protein